MGDSDFEFSSGTNKRPIYKHRRERVPNWTQTEKDTLRNICQQYANIIDNKRTDNTMCSRKNRAWVDITQKMVQMGYFRDVARVREAYARMKKCDKQLERMAERKARGAELLAKPGTKHVSDDDNEYKHNHNVNVVEDGHRDNHGKRVTYGRRRSANWSQTESGMMKQLCLPHVDVLLDMRCTADVVMKKNTVWKGICRQMLRAGYQRDVCMIKCHWRHLKKIILLEKQEQLGKTAETAQNEKGCLQLTTGEIQVDNLHLKTEIDSEMDNEAAALLSANEKTDANNLKSDATDVSNADTSTEDENSKEARMPRRSKRKRSSRKCNDFIFSSIKSLRSFTPNIIPNTKNNCNEEVQQMPYKCDGNDLLDTSNDVDYDEQIPGSTTFTMKNEHEYKTELYRYKLAVEQKRLALLDLQFEQTRSQMNYERGLYDMDVKAKRLKLEQMRKPELE